MRKYWSIQEIETLKRLYPDCKTSTLEGIFNTKSSIICAQARRLGIKKSEGFMKSPLSGRISKNNDIGAATRFTKQTGGWNKGLKQADYMKPEMIEKIKKTQFQKGQDPHNSVPIGTERITAEGYVEIKTHHHKGVGKNKNFQLKHRVIYEAEFGKIPEGMIVEFLDGNRQNLDISNLVLRTRYENLDRNFNSDVAILKRFFGVKDPENIEKIINEVPELIEQKRKTIQLNKKIKEHYAK